MRKYRRVGLFAIVSTWAIPALLVLFACGCSGSRGSYDVANYDGYWLVGQKDGEFSEVGLERSANGNIPQLFIGMSSGETLDTGSLTLAEVERVMGPGKHFSSTVNEVDMELIAFKKDGTTIYWAETLGLCSLSCREGSVGLSRTAQHQLPLNRQQMEAALGPPIKWKRVHGANP